MTDILAWLASGAGLYKPTIMLVTAVSAGILAGVILYLHRMVLPEERWVQYFGWGYSVFSFQYILQAVASWAESWSLLSALVGPVQTSAHLIGSPLNNLCFLAAARSLLGYGGFSLGLIGSAASLRSQPHRTKRKLLRSPSSNWVLPPWALAIAALTVVFQVGPQTYWYNRVLDAAFSAYCLGWMGWALYINFGPQKRPVLAATNLLGALLYSLLNVAFAINPILAGKQWWPSLAERVEADLASLEADWVTPLKALDAFVLAVAFILKILLFLGVLLLIIKALLFLAPETARNLLAEIALGRGKYLSSRGVVRAIGESVEADLAALCIRLPGVREERVAWWRWLARPKRGKPDLEVTVLPPSHKSIVAWVLRTGDFQICQDVDQAPKIKSRYLKWEEGMHSFVTVPIFYHGAVVACLNVEWSRPRGYSSSAVRRIQQMAEILGPTIDARRQVIAFDALIGRFRSLEVESHGLEATLKEIFEAVHDVLSPFATSALIDLGFRSAWIACNDHGTHLRIGETSDERELIEQSKSFATSRGDEILRIHREKLVFEDQAFGKLWLLAARHQDPTTRPSLVFDYLHRRAVASLVADAIFDIQRVELNGILNRLQNALNLNLSNTIDPWFRAAEQAAKEAGFLWVAACVTEEEKLRYFGPDWTQVLVRDPRQGLSEPMPERRMWRCSSLDNPSDQACHVLSFKLTSLGAWLWLGVSRKGPGTELKLPSPCSVFLESFAQALDSALVRIEKHRSQLRSKTLETIATRVETTGLVMHTLGNGDQALVSRISRLQDILPPVGRPMTEDVRKKVLEIREAVQAHHRLTEVFRSPVPSDDRLRIPLRNAIDPIRSLYEEHFQSHQIIMQFQIEPEDVEVGVPLDTAYIALVTIINNAAEAIRRNGTIKIQAWAYDGKVLCKIEDDGSGIKEDLRERIFEGGFSTKPGGTGVGLFLVRNSMWRHQGDLTLEPSQPGRTAFIIHFPK